MHFGLTTLIAFAAFQKMTFGVSHDKIILGFEQMLRFPVARSTLCQCHADVLPGVPSPRRSMHLVEALRASPVV